MEVKITYDPTVIPPQATAQIEYIDKEYLKIETLYSMDQFDNAMESFRRINRKLEKLFDRNPEEKIDSDSFILINTNTISICVERKEYK